MKTIHHYVLRVREQMMLQKCTNQWMLRTSWCWYTSYRSAEIKFLVNFYQWIREWSAEISTRFFCLEKREIQLLFWIWIPDSGDHNGCHTSLKSSIHPFIWNLNHETTSTQMNVISMNVLLQVSFRFLSRWYCVIVVLVVDKMDFWKFFWDYYAVWLVLFWHSYVLMSCGFNFLPGVRYSQRVWFT